jgi:hypothetical protein
MRQVKKAKNIKYALYMNNLLVFLFNVNINHRLLIKGVENSEVNRTIAIKGKTPFFY